jgi:hypothetical protein
VLRKVQRGKKRSAPSGKYCSVSREIALEKKRPFLMGEGQAAASPASEDSLRKAIRQEMPKARKAKKSCAKSWIGIGSLRPASSYTKV